jgi:hypothetical protein
MKLHNYYSSEPLLVADCIHVPAVVAEVDTVVADGNIENWLGLYDGAKFQFHFSVAIAMIALRRASPTLTESVHLHP